MFRLVLAVVLILLVSGCDQQLATEDGGQARKRPSAAMEFVSRPDLTPPVIEVSTATGGADPGYVFLLARIRERADGEPQGHALILDNDAQPVWAMRFDDEEGVFGNDLAVQSYRGEPVLTYWRGTSPERGWGTGEYVLLNQAYQEVATVGTGNGMPDADFHDMRITARGTAWLMSYPTQDGDRPVRDGAIQEVDIATGQVLFEWRGTDHVELDESYEPVPTDEDQPYDYFHINSVDEDADGNLLVSARHTHALYKIDRNTGEVLWRLGGKRSDFTLGADVAFSWQHDARWLPDGRISLLDNASNDDREGPPSRGLVLDLDEDAGSVELVSAYPHPDGHTSGSQAGYQILPSGNSFAGWGSRPSFTEFDPSGEVVLHASFADDIFSYRALRAEWTGQPAEPPTAVAQADDSGTTTVFTSWNGATEVTDWRVLAGPATSDLRPVTDAQKTGFETAIELTEDAAFVAVEALDEHGNTLARSAPTKVRTSG